MQAMEPTNDNPLQAWSALVSNYAGIRFRQQPVSPTTIARATRPAVASSLIASWLEGRDVPRTAAEHEILMRALDLTHRIEQLPEGVDAGPLWQKAQLRSMIEFAWEGALEAVKDEMPHCVTDRSRGIPTESFSGFPVRMRRLRDYERLDEAGLDNVLYNTFNAHEFLAAFQERYYSALTQQEVVDAIGCSNRSRLRQLRDGINLPSHTLPEIKHGIEAASTPELAQRFEDLVIGNRLAIIHSVQNGDDPRNKVSGEHLNFMPLRYWQSVLDECVARHSNNPAASKQPFWAEDILPIETKGDYLRALRGLNHMNAHTVGELMSLQEQSYRTTYEQRGIALAPHVVDIFESALPGFDRDLYAALPTQRSAWLAPDEASRAQAVLAGRAASGTGHSYLS